MADKKERTMLIDLKKQLQEAELSLVSGAGFGNEQLKTIQERLYKMIDYTVKRHDWYVDQCHRLQQIGIALIASGAAIAAIFGKVDSLARITQYLAGVFVVSLVLLGFTLVYLYNSYLAGDHPYRKVVDISSWFFKYSFPEKLPQNLSGSPETARKQVAQEAEGIAKFFERFLSHAKRDIDLIREDIEQVAVLLLLQRYRAQQVRTMARTLSWGLLFSIVVFVLLTLSFLFAASTKPPSTGAALRRPRRRPSRPLSINLVRRPRRRPGPARLNLPTKLRLRLNCPHEQREE
jgi:hypothetical protein